MRRLSNITKSLVGVLSSVLLFETAVHAIDSAEGKQLNEMVNEIAQGIPSPTCVDRHLLTPLIHLGKPDTSESTQLLESRGLQLNTNIREWTRNETLILIRESFPVKHGNYHVVNLGDGDRCGTVFAFEQPKSIGRYLIIRAIFGPPRASRSTMNYYLFDMSSLNPRLVAKGQEHLLSQ